MLVGGRKISYLGVNYKKKLVKFIDLKVFECILGLLKSCVVGIFNEGFGLLRKFIMFY